MMDYIHCTGTHAQLMCVYKQVLTAECVRVCAREGERENRWEDVFIECVCRMQIEIYCCRADYWIRVGNKL